MTEKQINEKLEKRISKLEKELFDCNKALKLRKESEEQYRTLIELSPDPIVIHSRGKILFVNEEYAVLGGLSSPEEAIGKSIFDVVPPVKRPDTLDDHDAHDNPHGKIIRDNESPPAIEVHLIRPEGMEVIYEVSARNITYQGQDAVLLVHRDITERKKVEEKLKESEEMYRKLFEHAGFAIALVDAETGQAIEVNRKAHEGLGYTEEESKNIRAEAFESQEAPQEVLEHFKLIVEKGSDLFETRHKTKSGEIRDMLISAVAIKIGGRDCIHNISIDITDRKQAEEELRQSAALYRKLFEHSGVGIILADPETGERVEFNKRAHEMIGYTREEYQNLRFSQTDSDKSYEEISRHHKRIIEKGPDVFEIRQKTKNGEVRDVLSSCISVNIGGKDYIQAITIDITDRKQSEKALQESEEMYRKLFEHAGVGISLMDPETLERLEFNRAAHEMLGYSRYEYEQLNKNQTDLSMKEEVARHAKEIIEKGSDVFEAKRLAKNGEKRDILFSTVPVSIGSKNYIHSIYLDITDRKQAEKALRESEDRFRLLFNSAANGIFVHDFEGNFVEVSQRGCETLGYTYDELISMNLVDIDAEVIEKGHRERLWNSLKPDVPMTIESTHRRKDGTMYQVEVSCVLIESEGRKLIMGIDRDISKRVEAEKEREKYQKQFQQAQKMEAIGTLAGGIAHDFNNLLMGIQGRTSLMLIDIESSHPFFEHLRGVEDYVKNAADLTRQLLGFARGGKYEVSTTDINEFIKNQNQLFGRTRKEVSIHGKYEKDISSVDVDRGQMAQVLLNLYVNAWQAMPAGGDIYISTESVTLNKDYVEPYGADPGGYVKVSVTDTGVGMDRVTQQRIFEPFFSTKEMGRGTGLGLASTYGIIKNHEGFINVYSEKGEGTTFNIYLPVSESIVNEKEDQDKEILKGSEAILFVDDEDMVIDVGIKMLEALGYEVLVARTGNEALEQYEMHKEKIDLIILDMIMPDIGGGKVFDILKEREPEIKVLLSSGYSLNGQASKILKRGCGGFIQKPFNMESLSQKIRDVLDK